MGGIRTFMRYVYRRFDPKQYHFTILGPDNSELNVLAADLEGLDFEIIKVSERPSAYELSIATVKLLMRGRYDLVHSQGFTSGICAALPAFLFRTPHILTSHDVLSNAQFRGFSGRIKKIGMGAALSLVNTIHSVSHDAQANLLEFFPAFARKNGKCVVILNGIESDRFVNAVPRDLRSELGVGEDFFLIGFLGRFMAQKGFVYLVDAIEQLKKSGNLPKKPLVLTFGDGAFIREEKAAITARGLDEYFKFLPFTPNVASVIKGLDLVVMPSLWEACPLLPMEVLACGTPLLAFGCIGLREVAANTPTHLVPSKDLNAFINEIKLFMENDMRNIFADFAPLAVERYDVTSTVTSLQSLISQRMR
ncbi:MAG: glycosyltransferase family 4 protein [Desulfuromonadaceae bacterium]|nr:glycosyltransferase family 4 protein [Desulfuromonadaceae bacterium]MDD5104819.1 glycosyltransferase family 4 protein [Desulfuromonadaceae bacterium]